MHRLLLFYVTNCFRGQQIRRIFKLATYNSRAHNQAWPITLRFDSVQLGILCIHNWNVSAFRKRLHDFRGAHWTTFPAGKRSRQSFRRYIRIQKRSRPPLTRDLQDTDTDLHKRIKVELSCTAFPGSTTNYLWSWFAGGWHLKTNLYENNLR